MCCTAVQMQPTTFAQAKQRKRTLRALKSELGPLGLHSNALLPTLTKAVKACHLNVKLHDYKFGVIVSMACPYHSKNDT